MRLSSSLGNTDKITQDLFSSLSVGQIAKPVGIRDVEGNLPYNRPTVEFAKTVGGGAFDAPAVTDLNIFHLPANTQYLPLVGQFSPKQVHKPDKHKRGCLLSQTAPSRIRG